MQVWRALEDRGHLDLVAAYFRYSAEWTDLKAADRSRRSGQGNDPVFAVSATKPNAPSAAAGEGSDV